MAKKAVSARGLSVRLVCQAFVISETCYRYQPILSNENAEIADWLIRLTDNQKDWGFGLCRDYLRNVKRYEWNHKRIYRIYCELELNLRIRSRKRIQREKPKRLRCDNGPEFISQDLEKWTDKHDIQLEFIQPGKPQQNAYVERYNRTVRYSWLSQYLFDSIKEVQDYATGWLWFYNHERPNKANGGLPPKQMLRAA